MLDMTSPTRSAYTPIVVSAGTASAVASSVFGPGLTSALAGQVANFEVSPKDQYSNIRTAGNIASNGQLAIAMTQGGVNFAVTLDNANAAGNRVTTIKGERWCIVP
jgi:hypothetical protein